MSVTMSESVAKPLGEVTDLAGYLAAIHNQLNGQMGALFRGHRDHTWKLVPAVARQQHPQSTLATEKAMLAEFKRRALPYLDAHYDLHDADWLAIAQHHGMPTRLLDWSGSALAALWFAVNAPAEAKEGQEQKPAAVWMLTYEEGDVVSDDQRAAPFDVPRTMLVRPRHVTRRITAQDGWFSLHLSQYETKGKPAFVSLETNLKYKDRLSYVTIPAKAFGQLRMQLAQSGVTSAVLFPDLAGVANYITWTHFYPPDEHVPRILSLL